MNKLRISITTALVLLTLSSMVLGRGTESKTTKSVSISEAKDGDGLVVAVSEALARSLLEGMVGAESELWRRHGCRFRGRAPQARPGRSRQPGHLRDEDGVLTARRSGRSLKLDFDDADDGGGLEVKMPWAVAECLLDGSATLSAKDAGSIKVKITGSEGGSFEFKVD